MFSQIRMLNLLQSLTVYTQPRVCTLLFLGFSAGLPFLLVFSTLSAWLHEAGVSKTTIGAFSLIGIMYSIKVVWSPVVDRLPLPLLHRGLGRRRSWMLLAQCGIASGLILLAFCDPKSDLLLIAYLSLLVAFSSATQDIAIDAFRIEVASVEVQGAMAAAYILGYRIALLVAGAGSFYVAQWHGWSNTYLVMAGFSCIGILVTLICREPEENPARIAYSHEARVCAFVENSTLPASLQSITAWFIGAVVCPFTDFFSRHGRTAILILIFVGLFRVSDITMGVMANPFYLDLGFSKIDIANITKVFGFFMTILGAMLGGVLVMRWGRMQTVMLGAVLVAVTNLLFAWLAVSKPSLTLLAIVISADNLSGGIATAAFIAYLSGLTSPAYTATQYALFSSLMTLPAKLIGGISGYMVDLVDYPWFFIYASALGIPAIALCWLLNRYSATEHANAR